MNFHEIMHMIKHIMMITSFVLIMMLVIEYINVQTKGIWNSRLQKNKWLQVIIAAFLGVIPGCLGAFTVVSLYTHKSMNFAALVAVMIATFGDEAFIMISLMPEEAFVIMGIVVLVAILTGFIVLFFSKKEEVPIVGYVIHNNEKILNKFNKQTIINQLKNISFERALMLIGLTVFSYFLIIDKISCQTGWGWEKITILIGAVVIIFISLTASDHFLKEHLWKHVIKKHLLRLFLWTTVAMVIIQLIPNVGEFNQWILDNKLIMLLIAVGIGIIPESGPNIIFITLFLNGTIPFSILLASSIVQDGHGSIPLFAENKKSFVYMKLINILVGLIVGYIGLEFF